MRNLIPQLPHNEAAVPPKLEPLGKTDAVFGLRTLHIHNRSNF